MRTLVAFAAAFAIAAPALAAPEIGRPAPALALLDAAGKPVKLADYKGKTVVIEWNNPGCPFVQKHYNSGNMQRTQAAAKKDGAVWLTVNSSAQGNQGYLTGPEAQAFVTKSKALPTAYLLDHAGVAGHAYAAKTTPQMFVVNGQGNLTYMGGIDDKPTSNVADIASARNHVLAALAEMKAGKPVSQPVTRSYGCSVKYSS